jgi:hypothetical protein
MPSGSLREASLPDKRQQFDAFFIIVAADLQLACQKNMHG